MRARLVPGLFVLFWSTGFVGARLGAPVSDPFAILAVRFGLAALLLAGVAAAMRAPWPPDWRARGHAVVAGLLVHAVYLGGVFWSIDRGLAAGVSALIVGLQPLLTAALAHPLLGERTTPLQWLGLIAGLGGVALVAWDRLAGGHTGVAPIAASATGLVGITLGTIYQRRFCRTIDIRSGGAIQYATCAAVLGAAAVATGGTHLEWGLRLAGALAWMVVVLSGLSVALLYRLLARGEATRVASLLYLVPGSAALEAWLLFDERLTAAAIAGLVVVAAAVGLVSAAGARARPQPAAS